MGYKTPFGEKKNLSLEKIQTMITLTQLEYIVAVDTYRHFGRAAEHSRRGTRYDVDWRDRVEQQVVHNTPGGRALSRRVIGLVLTASALLVVAGCGGGGTDTTVRSGRQGVVAAAEGDVDAAGLRTVTYQGVAFDVPGSWPVYDLAADPSTCVRFDVNAVYLGHPGVDMVCPAVAVGRADAVLVEPNDDTARTGTPVDASPEVSATSVNGLEAQVVDTSATSSEVVAAFPGAGVSATLTYRDSDDTARRILASFRSAGS
jgi:hypothetical protein